MSVTYSPAPAQGIGTPASSTDTAIVRWNGTGGDTIQDSGVTIDASDNISTSGRIKSGDGTVGDAAFGPASDTDTGVYWTTGTMWLAAHGFQLYMFDLSNFRPKKSMRFDSYYGTAALPAVSVYSDSNSGMYFDNSDGVYFSTGGTERVRINTASIDFALPIKAAVMDDTARNALSPASGWQIFNTTSGKPEWYDGSGWIEADGTSA